MAPQNTWQCGIDIFVWKSINKKHYGTVFHIRTS
jgi:hypothetical protein